MHLFNVTTGNLVTRPATVFVVAANAEQALVLAKTLGGLRVALTLARPFVERVSESKDLTASIIAWGYDDEGPLPESKDDKGT